MAESEEENNSDKPVTKDKIIRIQLKNPQQRKWELRTRGLSPAIKFPTIQLFDCEGNLLVETNDDNVSIKSSSFDRPALRNSKSLKEQDFRYIIHKKSIQKHNTISGDRIYTKVYGTPAIVKSNWMETDSQGYIIRSNDSVTNIPNCLLRNNLSLSSNSNLDISEQTDVSSELSSVKSSDNETSDIDQNNNVKCSVVPIHKHENIFYKKNNNPGLFETYSKTLTNNHNLRFIKNKNLEHLRKAKSFNQKRVEFTHKCLRRSYSGVTYVSAGNKNVLFDTYLKGLPRVNADTDLFTCRQNNLDNVQISHPQFVNRISKDIDNNKTWDSSEELYNVPTDVAAECELRKRLKLYRRTISEIEPHYRKSNALADRRHSANDVTLDYQTSSSESLDEADLVLNRLRRRILKNKIRERNLGKSNKIKQQSKQSPKEVQNAAEVATRNVAHVSRWNMGSNISQHSAKGLKGRRARSSGDLCNGDNKSQSESSVCGSVVGDVMGWNRSLPNHLDGNRHLADYSRVNNNYGEFGTYRHHTKGRGLRYRVSKSGSDAEPVWKLQDPGCDQGYGSERSPEEDFAPPIQPPLSLEDYEAQLRAIYPFINNENTYTVVVEKDGRGLGMSVCGGSGLVRIRRLYPPQPAWRTGRLAPRDLLLSANGVPLAGLSTYEALEVLRTAAPRVELRVCRPPPDVLESVTPPEPPTPPARTPHPPHIPILDPLNCHPMHARLSATTSSATTSSSEGRGRREVSPDDRRNLHLPDLDRPLPVYDVQYGEFDIVLTKVNGSLGFTLRKEDHSALGHYVRALVREPALSDGRIQPGDRIVAVNETPMSNMSHAEAVAFLRACDSEVRLRLYRDHAATPQSPMSPKEEGPTDSDVPSHKPKPPLRPEAVSMLCDLAARRLTPDTVDGSRSPCLSPRKFRKLTKENHYEQPNDRCKSESHSPKHPKAMDGFGKLQRAQSVTIMSSGYNRKQKLSLTVPPQGYELNNLNNEVLDAPNLYQEKIKLKSHDSSQRYHDMSQRYPGTNEPMSMPVGPVSDDIMFKHKNPVYQSAVLQTSSDVGEGQKDDGNLKKWKGVTLSPENERKPIVMPTPPPEKDAVQKENIKPLKTNTEPITEPTIVTVELTRGWNSRLGFSVQSHPDCGQSYISCVHNDSVAARDGRLRSGDVILQVNDENVTSMKASEVIDLLRILRGSICITVLRPPNNQ